VFDLRVNNAKGPNARPLEHNVGLPSCEKFRFLPHTWKSELNGTVVRTIDNSKYFISMILPWIPHCPLSLMESQTPHAIIFSI
jgi:hypothetical protein